MTRGKFEKSGILKILEKSLINVIKQSTANDDFDEIELIGQSFNIPKIQKI